MTSSDLKNGNGEWLVIGRSWGCVWPDMRILIEYKENADANWTTLTDVTYPAGKGSVTPLFIRPYTGYMTNHDQLRVTLSKKPGSTGTQSISAMKMLTNRWGGQGQGTELHFPYDWDENQNINLNGNLKIKNKTIEAIIDERVESNEAIDTRINDVAAVAEGKTNSYVVEKTQGNNKLDSQNDSVVLSSGDFPLTTTGGSQIVHADLKIGDIIYITNTNVPDRWVGLKQNNSVTLYKMETAKVDLANYYTKSEVDALIESKISQYLTSIEADDVEFGS